MGLIIPVRKDGRTEILDVDGKKCTIRSIFPEVPREISMKDALSIVAEIYGGYAAFVIENWDHEDGVYVTPDGLMTYGEIMSSPKWHVSSWAPFPYEQFIGYYPFLTVGATKGLIVPGTRIYIGGDKGLAGRLIPVEFAPCMDEALWAREHSTTYVWLPKLNRGFYITDAQFNYEHEPHSWKGEITPQEAMKLFWQPEPPGDWHWYVEFGAPCVLVGA